MNSVKKYQRISDGNRIDIFEAVLEILENQALTDEDASIRRYAILLISQLGEDKYLELFIQALHDQDKGVREQAGRALARLGSVAVHGLTILLSDSDWKVRYRVAESLGLSNAPEAKVPLLEALTDEKDHVRYMAVKGIAMTGTPEDVGRLYPLLDDPNPYVRSMAVRTIGTFGGVSSRENLRKAFFKESEEEIRTIILNIINRT